MWRYLFHLGVLPLQICVTKVSAPGCCLSAGWVFLAEAGACRIPGYPHAYRCGGWRTMTRSRCLGSQELQLTANKLTPSWNCCFFWKKIKKTCQFSALSAVLSPMSSASMPSAGSPCSAWSGFSQKNKVNPGRTLGWKQGWSQKFKGRRVEQAHVAGRALGEVSPWDSADGLLGSSAPVPPYPGLESSPALGDEGSVQSDGVRSGVEWAWDLSADIRVYKSINQKSKILQGTPCSCLGKWRALKKECSRTWESCSQCN